jgi:hypothetical protein
MKTITILFLLLSGNSLFGQITLASKLKLADTVLLISHSSISDSSNIVVDSFGREVKLTNLLINDKLNRQAIIESKILSTVEIDSLSNILTYPSKSINMVILSGCFIPHHSIIIIKNNKISFIDLSFYCLNFNSSNDIRELEIEEDKWENLYNLFKNFGFKYEMVKGE